jgi:pimeloyl-ACP methyl ester carboxylesterase
VAEAVPQGRLSVLPGCSHFGYLEFPDLVHRHIESFMHRP